MKQDNCDATWGEFKAAYCFLGGRGTHIPWPTVRGLSFSHSSCGQPVFQHCVDRSGIVRRALSCVPAPADGAEASLCAGSACKRGVSSRKRSMGRSERSQQQRPGPLQRGRSGEPQWPPGGKGLAGARL